MKVERILLVTDSVINIVLGLMLVLFPGWLINMLGVPTVESAFYPSILGAVLFGIGVALLLPKGSGLGLYGAVAINLSGGIVLGLWLIFGDLNLPTRGNIFLWGLVLILVGLSTIELLTFFKTRKSNMEQ